MERITLNTIFNLFKLPNPPWNVSQWMYQGFIEQDSQNSSVWNWIADDPDNVPREVLRRRGEVFATFWYQAQLMSGGSKLRALENFIKKVGLKIYTYGLKRYENLREGTSDERVRFERNFSINDVYRTLQNGTGYTEILSNFTDPTEIEYFLNKILIIIKDEFENEN
jgi:hypothetical protein